MRRGYKRRRARRKAAARRALIDRDKLMNTDQRAVGTAMVEVFAKVQKLPKEIQLLSLAAAFILMAEALEFSTNDTYQAVVNLMKDPTTASGKGLRFDAMLFHLRTELKGEDGESGLGASPFG